jgi:hypothetical protein
MTVRVRVTKIAPEQPVVRLSWKRGGEGLGGDAARGEFAAEGGANDVAVGRWSAPLPLATVVGRSRGWTFVTVAVHSQRPPGKRRFAIPISVESAEVEFEFAESGKVFKGFSEPAPRGASVSFAFPGDALRKRGANDADFIGQLQGLSSYARARRGSLERLFIEPAPLPKDFAIIGRLGGYGEGSGQGKREGSGYGVRHCNPEILADECRTLHLLGINGMVQGSLRMAEIGGYGNEFRRLCFGGPGSGSPMGRGKKKNLDPCPFDPDLKASMAERVRAAIDDCKRSGCKESWSLWWDEIGVAAKEHIQNCPRCAEAFREYLRSQKLQRTAFGKASWEEVSPYAIFDASQARVNRKGKIRQGGALAAAPDDPQDALRFYYTHRFLTYATAKLFPEAAAQFKAAGIPLYSMQGPTPSWNGSSLDWHEFYDLGANTAIVFETSNRDPQMWQFESYLSDIARDIAARHDIRFGCLVKPHRGAPLQRMLSVISRGATVIEWYTYGPDYSKADSFSQSPDLLEKVGRADRFLGRAEPYLYGAHWAGKPEVAFASPRSSEIWGKATDLGITAFEDAKWVYLALAHAHIPVDVLSEQQLADGKLAQYKVIYVVGPNLRRDAAARLQHWVRDGGTLWTDAIGLSRDEANQPLELLVPAGRRLESWGSVEPYRAINLKPFAESNVPPYAKFRYNGSEFRAAVGRELAPEPSAETLARFADGKPAVTRTAMGRGEVIADRFWAGLTYSAKVRRPNFNMNTDFDPALRDLIAASSLNRKVYRPVVPQEPLVEAVALENNGQRSIALMNWAYRGDELQPAKNLRVDLSALGNVAAVKSLNHGPLRLQNQTVVLPQLDAIDLLMVE